MEGEKTKPFKRLKQLLTSENLWIYILSLIKKQSKLYAYTLDEEIVKTFGFKPNKIMIYIVLYKLENEKLIDSEYKERRKYYTMTKKGVETLLVAQNYFRNLAEKI